MFFIGDAADRPESSLQDCGTCKSFSSPSLYSAPFDGISDSRGYYERRTVREGYGKITELLRCTKQSRQAETREQLQEFTLERPDTMAWEKQKERGIDGGGADIHIF